MTNSTIIKRFSKNKRLPKNKRLQKNKRSRKFGFLNKKNLNLKFIENMIDKLLTVYGGPVSPEIEENNYNKFSEKMKKSNKWFFNFFNNLSDLSKLNN